MKGRAREGREQVSGMVFICRQPVSSIFSLLAREASDSLWLNQCGDRSKGFRLQTTGSIDLDVSNTTTFPPPSHTGILVTALRVASSCLTAFTVLHGCTNGGSTHTLALR